MFTTLGIVKTLFQIFPFIVYTDKSCGVLQRVASICKRPRCEPAENVRTMRCLVAGLRTTCYLLIDNSHGTRRSHSSTSETLFSCFVHSISHARVLRRETERDKLTTLSSILHV
jgi:hypothetical protein